MTGIVNVPADAVRPLQRIVLHAARPPASNHPTADGVRGAEKMLALLGSAGPGRRRHLPALRRRVGPAAGPGRGVARGQAGGDEAAARLRGDHPRDERRPQAPVAASRAADWPRRSAAATCSA